MLLEMGRIFCSARFCFNSTATSYFSFFKYPNDDVRCEEWLKRAGRDDLLNKTPLQVYKGGYRLCDEHFCDDQFYNISRKRLLNFALPTIFPKEPEGSAWKHSFTEASLSRKRKRDVPTEDSSHLTNTADTEALGVVGSGDPADAPAAPVMTFSVHNLSSDRTDDIVSPDTKLPEPRILKTYSTASPTTKVPLLESENHTTIPITSTVKEVSEQMLSKCTTHDAQSLETDLSESWISEVSIYITTKPAANVPLSTSSKKTTYPLHSSVTKVADPESVGDTDHETVLLDANSNKPRTLQAISTNSIRKRRSGLTYAIRHTATETKLRKKLHAYRSRVSRLTEKLRKTEAELLELKRRDHVKFVLASVPHYLTKQGKRFLMSKLK